MRSVLGFPNPVNEKAARVVAAVVALCAALALGTGWLWLLVPLALGFVGRVLTGPTLSPLGRFAMWFARTRLGEPRYVPGPPKRFAQAIGASVTSVGVVALAVGAPPLAVGVLLVMLAFATLEAAFALCVGCKVFALLVRAGFVPDRLCADCADISRRLAPDRTPA